MSRVFEHVLHLAMALGALAAGPLGCADEEHPLAASMGVDASLEGGGLVESLSPRSGPCWQARAQALPARLVAMTSADAGADAAPAGKLVFTDDLVDRFTSLCGTCHGAQTGAAGNFAILNASDFSADNAKQILTHLQSNAACPWKPGAAGDEPMPPCGSPGSVPYGQRASTDPYREFAELVKGWLDAGSPKSFLVPSSDDTASAMAEGGTTEAPSYAMSPGTADAITNLGNCIPSHDLALAPRADGAKAMDDLFAAAVADPGATEREKQLGLPSRLRDTDLTSLDAKVLAERGIFAYAPTYPLWSDNAGKLRYVRVPLGTSIHFDKATQKFDIPANTRFYKTFMKQVADVNGSLRWRKVETRLIVSRPNTPDGNGGYLLHALFGTYRWSDDETDAVLVTTPQNNGLPFGDTLVQYTTDEQVAAAVLRGQPADPQDALVREGAARHYAVPSAQRCIDCHRGSPSEDFVLGFTPLQVKRRANGEGGVYEDTGPDELTQLARLLDYGVITGVDSPDDVLPLERSQGARAPRNAYELEAQAYMLGNCAHCHNPNGQPTLENPVLKDVLNFLPSEVGGIFQFPLERTSPRIFRGVSGTTPIPYITPSLVDQPTFAFVDQNDGAGPRLLGSVDTFLSGNLGDDGQMRVTQAWFAPWRSLIYRNVDNAYPYTQDHAFFPHMPMNTAGYDPRVKQVVSDWMVSIPSARKRPDLPEYAFFNASNVNAVDALDTSSQPYVEVLPGQPGYDAAVQAAGLRLEVLHSGNNAALPPAKDYLPTTPRYGDQGHTGDILDPRIVENAFCSSNAVPLSPPDEPGNVPSHPHWVTTDLTQPPGDYAPRRSDWQDALVNGGAGAPSITDRYCGRTGNPGEKIAADALSGVTFSDDLTTFVRTKVPFGLWQKKAGCSYPSQQTVAQVKHQHWMEVAPGVASTDPVFMQSPGGVIFNNICINCHGPRADGTGRMAKNLLIMTGGLGRVADLYDGLFGAPGATAALTHRHLTFGAAAMVPPPATAPFASSWARDWQGVSDDDRAARYVSWMALGGTKVNIPTAILDVVGTTRILGASRGGVDGLGTPDANMLALATALCAEIVGPLVTPTNREFLSPALGSAGTDFGFFGSKIAKGALILTNGDAEMWLRLCNLGHVAPVHVLNVTDISPAAITAEQEQPGQGGVQAYGVVSDTQGYFPANTRVGNDRGTVDPSLTKDNLWPWCLKPVYRGGKADQPLKEALGDRASSVPICPDDWAQHFMSVDDKTKWATRGAINAGFAVYRYLSDQEAQAPEPTYDQCELLK